MILNRCGIKLHVEEKGADRPHQQGLDNLEKRWRKRANDLQAQMLAWLERVDASDWSDFRGLLRFPLADRDLGLPGLRQSLGTGAGLDWLTRAEATALGLSRAEGYWLLEPGYRWRTSLKTEVRPLLLAGYEQECLNLFRMRWPNVKFATPLIVDPTAQNMRYGEDNIRRLASIKSETLIAVDHTQIHWGSIFDLDTFFRQRKCRLFTVLPTTYAVPDFATSIIAASKQLRRGLLRSAS